MASHYIAVVAREGSGEPPALEDAQAAFLQSRGMREVFSDSGVTVFATRETPVLPLPRGLLVGHVFPRDTAHGDPRTLSVAAADGRLEAELLESWWGEYVLFHAAPGGGCGLSVLRDPSGGVSCLHGFEGPLGFVTSDLSLASGLGIHAQRIDWDFIAQALVHPHVTTERTGLAGLRELLPGCSLLLAPGRTRQDARWTPWDFVRPPHRHVDPTEAATSVRTAVASVVRTWASLDRSLLVELSGGLDSSIVAMSLRGSGADVACCSLVTPVPGADERRYAMQVASALGVPLHVGHLGFGNARVDFEPPVPVARPRMSVLQYVAHEAVHAVAARVGTRSFYSGAGGDTVFGFLPGATPAVDAWLERGAAAAIAAIRNLSALHQCTFWTATRLTLRKRARGARVPSSPDVSLLAGPCSAPVIAHPWFSPPPDVLPGDRERIADLAGTQGFRDSAPRSATHCLRLPLLSQPVVEACLRVPAWMSIEDGRNRAIARRAFADLLPRDVLERRSKGSFMNYFGAIYRRNAIAMRDFLLGGHLHARGLLDADAVARFVATPLPARDTSFMRIFDLCMVENWVRHQR